MKSKEGDDDVGQARQHNTPRFSQAEVRTQQATKSQRDTAKTNYTNRINNSFPIFFFSVRGSLTYLSLSSEPWPESFVGNEFFKAFSGRTWQSSVRSHVSWMDRVCLFDVGNLYGLTILGTLLNKF